MYHCRRKIAIMSIFPFHHVRKPIVGTSALTTVILALIAAVCFVTVAHVAAVAMPGSATSVQSSLDPILSGINPVNNAGNTSHKFPKCAAATVLHNNSVSSFFLCLLKTLKCHNTRTYCLFTFV